MKKEPLYPHVPKGKTSEFHPTFGRPALYLDIKGKKHKLVGVEKSEDTAELWASNMRYYSGERIVIIPVVEGFALYREE